MELVTVMGSIAATLTTISFLPQSIKTIKTKNTQGISIWMYLLFNIGIIAWLIYGVILKEIPIIIANSITVMLTIPILIITIKNNK